MVSSMLSEAVKYTVGYAYIQMARSKSDSVIFKMLSVNPVTVIPCTIRLTLLKLTILVIN